MTLDPEQDGTVSDVWRDAVTTPEGDLSDNVQQSLAAGVVMAEAATSSRLMLSAAWKLGYRAGRAAQDEVNPFEPATAAAEEPLTQV